MTFKIVFVSALVLALLTLDLASAHRKGGCWSGGDGDRDRDWIHHTYIVFELSTTDIVTPNALFFGTAPLQVGTCPTIPCCGEVLMIMMVMMMMGTDIWTNVLFTSSDFTDVVGFDTGLCTLTPAINNTGSLYELCNIIHFFNDGADQVMLQGATNFGLQEQPQPFAVVGGVGAFNGASGTCTARVDPVTLNAVYDCDFFTPVFQE